MLSASCYTSTVIASFVRIISSLGFKSSSINSLLYITEKKLKYFPLMQMETLIVRNTGKNNIKAVIYNYNLQF